jgi:hypothetical protein
MHTCCTVSWHTQTTTLLLHAATFILAGTLLHETYIDGQVSHCSIMLHQHSCMCTAEFVLLQKCALLRPSVALPALLMVICLSDHIHLTCCDSVSAAAAVRYSSYTLLHPHLTHCCIHILHTAASTSYTQLLQHPSNAGACNLASSKPASQHMNQQDHPSAGQLVHWLLLRAAILCCCSARKATAPGPQTQGEDGPLKVLQHLQMS